MTATPHSCVEYPIYSWKKDTNEWREYKQPRGSSAQPKAEDHNASCLQNFEHLKSSQFSDSDVVIIRAKADQARKHPPCRQAFAKNFQMPEFWWTEYCRRSNGYFGNETLRDDDGNVLGMTSWGRFMVKILKDQGQYTWYKINIFVKWLVNPNQTWIVLFDVPEKLKPQVPHVFTTNLPKHHLLDPFWMYEAILEQLVDVQNQAVWDMRTEVRTIEKSMTKDQELDERYPALHELSRHAIHGSETLDLAVNTSARILARQKAFMEEMEDTSKGKKSGSRSVHERLLVFEHMLESLRSRASSNKERLLNQIQLAYNTVAQYDARLSVQIGKDTRADSRAMKTIAFVTLAFLPATFISAIFSTTFFNFEPDNGWVMSDKFWVYWVVAIPVTIATAGFWLLWQRRQEGRQQDKV